MVEAAGVLTAGDEGYAPGSYVVLMRLLTLGADDSRLQLFG
jgi:hypothetical protein